MATTITANGINFPDGSASAPSIGGTDTNTGLFTGSDIVGFATGGVERIKIDAQGDIFIGTTSDIAPANGTNLCVSDGTISRLILEKQSTIKFGLNVSTGFTIYDETNDAARFSITSTGVIQTGTAIGASGADGNQRLVVGRDGDCNIAVRATGSTTASTGIDFGDSGDDRSGRIQYMHNGDYMSFHTNGAGSGTSNERLRITSDGYLQQHKLIAVSYSDTRGISLSNADLTTSNFYNTTFFASDSTILDSNGHFVAPVHGIYRLYFRCTTDGSNGNRANVRLRKNGNTINEAYGGANDSNDYMSVSSEIVMELNAGEYLDIQVGQLHTLSGSQHKQVTFTMLG